MSSENNSPAAQVATDEMITHIRSGDGPTREKGWQQAATMGAPAVAPLVALMADTNFEIARAARRGLARNVHHTGRPGATADRLAVEAALVALLPGTPLPVKRELVWMLSEIGGPPTVAALAALLTDPPAREDARCALTRMPGDEATAALRTAFQTAQEEFRFALAESLRQRGETVAGYSSKKLTPVKQTTVSAGDPPAKL